MDLELRQTTGMFQDGSLIHMNECAYQNRCNCWVQDRVWSGRTTFVFKVPEPEPEAPSSAEVDSVRLSTEPLSFDPDAACFVGVHTGPMADDEEEDFVLKWEETVLQQNCEPATEVLLFSPTANTKYSRAFDNSVKGFPFEYRLPDWLVGKSKDQPCIGDQGYSERDDGLWYCNGEL